MCRSYLSCLEAWLSDLLECIPSQYIPLSKVETARLISRLYLKALIKFYQENKRSKFSDRGRKQVLDDMSRINGRLLDLFKDSDAIEEQHLFEVLSDFITAPFGDVLHLYASALQIFGIQYALQIYDLLRLCLKIRGDCNSKTRKSTLALCAEFYIQLQNAVAADPTLLGGIQQRRSAYSSVFNELCPKIGSEHCTGRLNPGMYIDALLRTL